MIGKPAAIVVQDLTLGIEEAQDALSAIRSGQVDALVVSRKGQGQEVVLLQGADLAYQVLFETLNEGALAVAEGGHITYANRRFAELVGRPLDEVLQSELHDFVAPDDAAALARHLADARHGSSKGELRLLGAGGAPIPVMVSVRAVEVAEATPTYTVVVTDLSALRAAEAERAESERQVRRREGQLAHAEALAHLGSWDWDSQSQAATWSDELYRIFGEDPAHFTPSRAAVVARIHPDDRQAYEAALARALQTGEMDVFELRIRRADGEERILSIRGHAVSPSGAQPVRMVGIARDVTEERRVERRLRDSLRDKEILLQEAHHRVKNNLQVISSMLSIQARYLADPAAREALRESQSRVHSIAFVHEAIYHSKDLASIDLDAYLRRLVTSVKKTYDGGTAEIELAVAPVRLGIDAGMACGLAVNELVTNALKHAFTGRSSGHVRVSARRVDSGEVEVEVADDGIGFPADLDYRNAQSLGLQLVCGLTAQLGGTLSLDRSAGTRFTIRFAAPA
jgi:PAS domain S-box-containing protein